jgi:hypothetical protein
LVRRLLLWCDWAYSPLDGYRPVNIPHLDGPHLGPETYLFVVG